MAKKKETATIRSSAAELDEATAIKKYLITASDGKQYNAMEVQDQT